jgi:hypothetical protein
MGRLTFMEEVLCGSAEDPSMNIVPEALMPYQSTG